jgi:hypothetical protein
MIFFKYYLLCALIFLSSRASSEMTGSIELEFPNKKLVHRFAGQNGKAIIVTMTGDDPVSWRMRIGVIIKEKVVDIDLSGGLEAIYLVGQLSRLDKVEDKDGLFFVYKKQRDGDQLDILCACFVWGEGYRIASIDGEMQAISFRGTAKNKSVDDYLSKQLIAHEKIWIRQSWWVNGGYFFKIE